MPKRKLSEDFENEQDILEAKLYEAKLEAFCSKALAEGVTDAQGNLIRSPDMEREWKSLYASIPGKPKGKNKKWKMEEENRKWMANPKTKRIINNQKNKWKVTQEAHKKMCMAKAKNISSSVDIDIGKPFLPSTSDEPQMKKCKKLENENLRSREDLGPCSNERGGTASEKGDCTGAQLGKQEVWSLSQLGLVIFLHSRFMVK